MPLELPLPMKVCLPCLGLGAVLFGVSFSVTHWMKWTGSSDTSASAGLWKICFDQNDNTYCYTWTSDTIEKFDLSRGWIHKTQAAECLALIAMLGAVGGTGLFLFTKLRPAIFVGFLSCFVSALLMIVGSAVFASDVTNDAFYKRVADLDWAFGFNIVAAILTAVAGVFLVLQLVYSRTTSNTPA